MNWQEPKDLTNTVRVSARRFEESPYASCYDNPKMVRGVYAGRFFPVFNGEDPIQKYWVLRRKAAIFDRATQALLENPEDVTARLQRIDLLMQDQRYGEALVDLGLLEHSLPGSPELLARRGLLFFETQRLDEAETDLSALIALGEGSTQAHFVRGLICERTGRPAEALLDYASAVEHGTEVDVFLRWGALLERMGQEQQAVEVYRRGVAETNGAILLRESLILRERAVGRFDAALSQIDSALAQARVGTRWLLLRAEVLEESGQAEPARLARFEALAEANRLVSRRNSVIAQVDRARVYIALDRPEEAIEDLRSALRRTPPSFVFDEIQALLEAAGVEDGRQ